MLVTPIYKASGLGNQLANIISIKCIAIDKGYDFAVAFPERFKGHFLTNLALPELKGLEVQIEGNEPISMPDSYTYYRESEANNGDYDPEIFNLKDNTIVHGLLQGEKYFKNHRKEIQEWLKVDKVDMPDNLCVINFRGGEYVGVKEFFLPYEYWYNAIENMRKINKNMKFEVHTDDPETAKLFFPYYPIIRDIETNWKAIRYAKYLILSNSSFAILPSWVNDDLKLGIAPKHFARYNEDYWFLEQNKYSHLTYQDKQGNLCKL
jgi:hypothetical protein